MLQELFLIARQRNNIRNAFADNMSADVKFSKAQIRKFVQSNGTFCSWLGNFGKKALRKFTVPLARGKLPGLVSNLNSNTKIKFKRKVSGKRVVKARRGFTLFISNEDINDIIKKRKPLEDSGELIDGVTETVKHKMQK